MLASTLLISPGPKPVTVRLCFGRVKLGPTGPLKSASGALVDGLRSRGEGAADAIFRTSIAEKRELLRECRCRRGEEEGIVVRGMWISQSRMSKGQRGRREEGAFKLIKPGSRWHDIFQGAAAKVQATAKDASVF